MNQTSLLGVFRPYRHLYLSAITLLPSEVKSEATRWPHGRYPPNCTYLFTSRWTGADHLRHTKYIALRDDKDPSRVVRETDAGAIS
jgi:hypothetical protein